MLGRSFRSLATPLFPGRNPRKRRLAALAGLLLVAGCGGGARSAPSEQHVRGNGYGFRAPASWTVTRRLRTVVVRDGRAVLQVSVFPQPRRFEASRWRQYVRGIDRAVAQVVEQ